MSNVLAATPGLIGPPDEAAPRSRADFKVVLLGSFAWIVLVSGAAWVINESSWAQTDPVMQARVPPTAATSNPAAVSAPSLYFANPFDTTEVFEFPAGTSEAQARAAVAEFLIDRARGRLGRFQHVTRVADAGPMQIGEMPTGR